MIEAVIFDLDGLLFDTETVSFKVYNEFIQAYGHTISQDEYAKEYSGRSLINNTIHAIESHDLPIDLENALSIVRKIEDRHLDLGVDLKPGAGRLLAYLKENHYRLAIGSSSLPERAEKMLDQYGISNCFDIKVFAGDVQNGKPAPDIFLKAVERLQIPKERCLVLEDSANGIEAARQGGIPVICVPDVIRVPESQLEKVAACYPSLDRVISYLKVN